MAKYIYNTTLESKYYQGREVLAESFYQIAANLINEYSTDNELIAAIVSGEAKMSANGSTVMSGGVSEHLDFLKSIENNKLDSDTGGLLFSPKYAPDGWHQQYFETEFECSSLNSIHEKDWNNDDMGFSSLKFYDSSEDEIIQGELSLEDWQSAIDANCVRTDLLWMPTFDYAIKSGFVSQKAVPSENVYVWALGVDLPVEYGGVQAVFAEGGMNLQYVDARYPSGLDGVAATRLNYSHPQLGDGLGTNRLRFVVRHPVGFKHRIQVVLEIFLA